MRAASPNLRPGLPARALFLALALACSGDESGQEPPEPVTPEGSQGPEGAGTAPEAPPERVIPEDAAWLNLSVVRADDLSPLANVEIQVLCRMGELSLMRRRAPTGEDGKVSINVDAGTYVSRITVTPTVQTAIFGVSVERAFGAYESEDFDITVPVAGVVFGRVVDELGEPLAGAKVVAWARERWDLENTPGAIDPLLIAATDDLGRFTMGGMTQGHFTLSVEHPGKAAVRRAAGVIRFGEVLRDVELRMSPARVIEGTVTGGGGEPLSNAQVVLGRAGRRRRVETSDAPNLIFLPSRQHVLATDREGRFRVEGVPADELWNYTVAHRLHIGAEGQLQPGQTRLEVALERGLVMEGVTRSAATGEPVARAQVRMLGETSARRRVPSRQEGRFRLSGLEAGQNIAVYAHADGFAPALVWPIEARADAVDIAVDLEEGLRIAGRIETADAALSGLVRLELIPDEGLPQEVLESGMDLKHPLTEFGLDRMQTSPEGMFLFKDVPAGSYVLRLSAQGREPRDVAVQAGREDLVLTYDG